VLSYNSSKENTAIKYHNMVIIWYDLDKSPGT
jgi:hypothetical protein